MAAYRSHPTTKDIITAFFIHRLAEDARKNVILAKSINTLLKGEILMEGEEAPSGLKDYVTTVSRLAYIYRVTQFDQQSVALIGMKSLADLVEHLEDQLFMIILISAEAMPWIAISYIIEMAGQALSESAGVIANWSRCRIILNWCRQKFANTLFTKGDTIECWIQKKGWEDILKEPERHGYQEFREAQTLWNQQNSGSQPPQQTQRQMDQPQQQRQQQQQQQKNLELQPQKSQPLPQQVSPQTMQQQQSQPQKILSQTARQWQPQPRPVSLQTIQPQQASYPQPQQILSQTSQQRQPQPRGVSPQTMQQQKYQPRQVLLQTAQQCQPQPRQISPQTMQQRQILLQIKPEYQSITKQNMPQTMLQQRKILPNQMMSLLGQQPRQPYTIQPQFPLHSQLQQANSGKRLLSGEMKPQKVVITRPQQHLITLPPGLPKYQQMQEIAKQLQRQKQGQQQFVIRQHQQQEYPQKQQIQPKQQEQSQQLHQQLQQQWISQKKPQQYQQQQHQQPQQLLQQQQKTVRDLQEHQDPGQKPLNSCTLCATNNCMHCSLYRCSVNSDCVHQSSSYDQLKEHVKKYHPQLSVTSMNFYYMGIRGELKIDECLCGRNKRRAAIKNWSTCVCGEFYCTMPNCTFQYLRKDVLTRHMFENHGQSVE